MVTGPPTDYMSAGSDNRAISGRLPTSPDQPPPPPVPPLIRRQTGPGGHVHTSSTSEAPIYSPTLSSFSAGSSIAAAAPPTVASTGSSTGTTTRMFPIRSVRHATKAATGPTVTAQPQHQQQQGSTTSFPSSITGPTNSHHPTQTTGAGSSHPNPPRPGSSVGSQQNKDGTGQSAGAGPGSPSRPSHQRHPTRPVPLDQILDDPPSQHKNRRRRRAGQQGDDDHGHGDDAEEDDDEQTGVAGGSTLGKSSVNSDKLLMTTRFEHEVGENGENFVITGRHGQIEQCEDEPIRVPGAVQAYGVLIVIDQLDNGMLAVKQVSENSRFVIGLPPAHLFRLSTFASVLEDGELDVLLDALDTLDERDHDVAVTDTGPIGITLSGYGLPGTDPSTDANSTSRLEWTCHAVLHRPDRARKPERFVIELEMVDDRVNPLTTIVDEPVTPSERGGMPDSDYGEHATPEQLLESTVSMIKPLRALTRTKNKRRGKKGANDVDVVALLSQITVQLNRASDMKTFLRTVAGIFRELTEFDRCMVYQFDADWNGQVVAELCDWTRTKDLFNGLFFPATDIPAQARELYKINKVRLLYDRDQPTARMCCRSIEEVESPLDMTHAYLRAMSPIHVKYLANMGVRSSMSISITAFGDLWGLVALHSYGKFGHRVSFPVRQLCKLLGAAISRNIERLAYAQRLHSRKLIHTAPTESNPSGYIVAKGEDLLLLFDADFGVLSIGDEAKILGPVTNSQELLAVLEYLRIKKWPTMHWTQDIRKDWSDIDYRPDFQIIAGALSVPLSPEGKDFIVFFRQGQLQEVKWAGNPHTNKTMSEDGSNRHLEPRKSFKVWSETVIGRCRTWTDEQLETGGALALVYGKFIAVWREKESALAANQLNSILLQNASNEVRTPLHAIVNYLELALDGDVSKDVRENLVRSQAASRSLIHVINDLLDLTRTERGQELFLQDPFDLPTTITEALAVHKAEAERRGLSLDVVENPTGTPACLLGDRAKIRQALSNCVSNAMKHTRQGGILVEWGELADADVEDALEKKADSIRIGISITDTGVGISEARLEAMFREFEQVSTTGDEIGQVEPQGATVGLGLAVVARIIRNLGGQLRVESKLGEGSKFTFVLPFRLPSEEDYRPRLTGNDSSQSGTETDSSRTISALGSRTATTGSTSLTRSNSQGSGASRDSKGSIDSLISAMSSTMLSPGNLHRKPVLDKNHSFGSQQSGHSSGSPTSGARRRHSLQGEIEVTSSSVPLRAVKIPQEFNVAAEQRSIERTALNSSDAPSEHDASSGRPAILRRHSSLPEAPAVHAVQQRQPSSTTDQRRRSALEKQRAIRAAAESQKFSPTHMSEYVKPPSTDDEDAISPLRILVVEDEPINRMILQKRLNKDGHEVVSVNDGVEGVRAIEQDSNGFDLVLMDLLMPIMGGLEATREIRKWEEENPTPHAQLRPSSILNGRLPILACSASLPERERPTIVEAGLDGWILKPIDLRRLRKLLRGAIDASVRKGEVYRQGNWENGGYLEQAPEIVTPPPVV